MKITNEYAIAYPHYKDTPKAVIAAIAYSLAMRLSCDDADEVKTILLSEWDSLTACGVVQQQRPIKSN